MHKLTQKEVFKGLNLENIDFYLLDTVDSTNTFAKEKLLNKDYLVVISEQQTAGRGRQGKEWYSPNAGNIYMTIKFRDKNPAPLSLIIGLLISEAMDSVSGQKINAGLKWPNDLLINKKKICGILIESEMSADEVEFIVGIGINYSLPKKESWWGEIGELADILPREKLMNSILQNIIDYKENGYKNWKDAWEKRCMHIGIELKALSNNQKDTDIGIFIGINEEGKMLLQTERGLKIISSGECSIKGIY
ncbi:MAG: biotin--[acetyl-CoA-carboxylase] ligase [SAR86 cluster bacterium]|nr:biotin--[acetyl-CoA-carboxylase] ligase [SAR86 cluster bacterium]